jgi:Domain of unknown function (DUF4160)
MYWEVGVLHHTPHFQAYYQEGTAIFSIDPIELMEGYIPRRQLRLVEAWAELHQGELMSDWQRLQSGQSPIPIEPLK